VVSVSSNRGSSHGRTHPAPCRRNGLVAIRRDLASLIEKLKTQPGFVIHVGFMDNGRFTVSEIWDSQEQHDRWFNENVKPKVSGVEQEVIEVHSVQMP
jgi:heme-degrading monooxygenase HmoA